MIELNFYNLSARLNNVDLSTIVLNLDYTDHLKGRVIERSIVLSNNKELRLSKVKSEISNCKFAFVNYNKTNNDYEINVIISQFTYYVIKPSKKHKGKFAVITYITSNEKGISIYDKYEMTRKTRAKYEERKREEMLRELEEEW